MTHEPCPHSRDEQVEFAYDEMDAVRARAFGAHLDGCPVCREAVAELRHAAELCRKARQLPVAGPRWTQDFDPDRARPRKPWWQRPVVWGPAVAAACGLLAWFVLHRPVVTPRPAPQDPADIQPEPAPAPAPVVALPVRVRAVSGDVQVRQQGHPAVTALSTETRLVAGATLEVAANGSAELELDDLSRLLLGADSSLTVDVVGASGDDLSLASGSVACRVHPRQASRPFSIAAGPGVVQVVGTTFAVRLAPDDALSVGVASGSVRVRPVTKTRSSVLVKAGQQVKLAAATVRRGNLDKRMRALLKPLMPEAPRSAQPARGHARIQPPPARQPEPPGTQMPAPAGRPGKDKPEPAPPTRPKTAVESIEDLVERLHLDTRWIFDELRIKMSEGKWSQVLRYLDDYLADPDSPNRSEATFLKAVCLEKLGRIRQAHQLYRHYLLTWPAGERATGAKHGLIRTRRGL